MSSSGSHEDTQTTEPTGADGEDLHGLTVEDDPDGTVDPGELAGTADENDEELQPRYSEEDLED